ncbi:MAG: hypothetical protein JST00_12610 [Deltaproteobacteria bacterium]|nr:hypothetical protein [Deltaproteobacteria bacterium]
MTKLAVSRLALLVPALAPFLVPFLTSSASPVAACDNSPLPALPTIECRSSELAFASEPVSDVRVFVDPDVPDQVAADLRDYLSRMWKVSVPVTKGAPSGDGHAIWVTSSEAPPPEGYALVRRDRRIVVSAKGRADLVAGAYALLEELGIRFFHPMQDFVPELDGPRFPRTLDVRRAASVKTRGIQFHTLHPLEYLATFLQPSEAHLAEAKRTIDWFVKTGQNHVQWYMLGTIDWNAYRGYARQILDYAHSRGVTVGIVVNLAARGSLQNNYVLVRDEARYQADIAEGLDRVLEVPWDEIELALGEFLGSDPQKLLVWLDAVVAHVGKVAPAVRVGIHNHIGNYPELYVDYRGTKTFFYHLPQYADPRLGQTVHTVFWYDTYRDKGMYSHPNFHFQREYMLSQLKAGRRVRYYPESAYWIGADVDVPVFLPEYLESRWIDIHRLDEDVKKAGLPKLDGHTVFSSGHEWGYWMTDYLVAKMLWDPTAPLDRFLSHVGAAYGSCAAGVTQELGQVIALQRKYLFEDQLIPYVSGEDATVEFGATIGITIRPIRKKFEELVTAPEPERVAFEEKVLAPLDALAKELRPIEDSLAARTRGADAALLPWISELRDGVRIVRIRIDHATTLYRAVLAHARGDNGAAREGLAASRAITQQAKAVIEAREKMYRFDVERLTGFYTNPTFYSFGYLRQAHTQCFYRRREEFARLIIEENVLGSTSDVPTCFE